MEKCPIRILPHEEIIEIDPEKTLLQNLKEQGFYIKSTCGGHATCSDCMIKVVMGEENITPPPFEEIRLLGNVFHITKERLSCQCKVSGPISIDISLHDEGTDQAKMLEKSQKNKKQMFNQRSKTHIRKGGQGMVKEEMYDPAVEEGKVTLTHHERQPQRQQGGSGRPQSGFRQNRPGDRNPARGGRPQQGGGGAKPGGPERPWYKHWEGKDGPTKYGQGKKHFGGGKRPKPFGFKNDAIVKTEGSGDDAKAQKESSPKTTPEGSSQGEN